MGTWNHICRTFTQQNHIRPSSQRGALDSAHCHPSHALPVAISVCNMPWIDAPKDSENKEPAWQDYPGGKFTKVNRASDSSKPSLPPPRRDPKIRPLIGIKFVRLYRFYKFPQPAPKEVNSVTLSKLHSKVIAQHNTRDPSDPEFWPAVGLSFGISFLEDFHGGWAEPAKAKIIQHMKDVYIGHVEYFDRMYIACYDSSSKPPVDAQTTAATISVRMLWIIAIDKVVRQKAAQKRWFSTVTRVLDELPRDKAPTEVEKLDRMKSKPSSKNANDALLTGTGGIPQLPSSDKPRNNDDDSASPEPEYKSETVSAALDKTNMVWSPPDDDPEDAKVQCSCFKCIIQ